MTILLINFFLLDWISFYQQKWVIGSLNKNMSKIDNEIWINAPNSTNAAEAAHALSNRRGKNLKLVTTIFQDMTKALLLVTFSLNKHKDDCNENTEDNKENIHNNLNFKELEYREKDLALREWEAKFKAEVGEAIGKGQRKEGATSAKGLLNGFLEYCAGRLLPNQWCLTLQGSKEYLIMVYAFV
ncbi:hypothetical protein RhiirC2_808891, partial [Rhizophagus irregularis]